MADSRSIVAGVSVAVALLCAAWAIYSSKHVGARGGSPAGAFAGARPAGPPGGAPGGAPGGGGPPGPSQQVIAVVTVPVTNESINVGIEAIGTANSNEAVDVTSKTSNIVTAIHFRDGQQVKVGDVLVELDRAQASAELAAATADYGDSVSQFNRSRELFATQSLSKAQYEQLEATMKANEARVAAARAKVADTYIRAPFSGRVGLRRVSLGTLISPGTVITTLDDTSAIKVDFAVPDVYVGELREGQTVKATTTAYTGRAFEGRVVSVDSRIDPTTRSVTVRAIVPNRDAALKPGMFLTVQLAKEQRKALVIPEEALVPEQARQFVYVMKNGTVAKREIRIGRREPGRVEVADGLSEGDRVVTEGTLKLREGAAVQELKVASSPAVQAAS
ncbi:MAG: efflux RND transporter periplasmic adaptor subunit [Pseudomonadota bacterium]